MVYVLPTLRNSAIRATFVVPFTDWKVEMPVSYQRMRAYLKQEMVKAQLKLGCTLALAGVLAEKDLETRICTLLRGGILYQGGWTFRREFERQRDDIGI